MRRLKLIIEFLTLENMFLLLIENNKLEILWEKEN